MDRLFFALYWIKYLCFVNYIATNKDFLKWLKIGLNLILKFTTKVFLFKLFLLDLQRLNNLLHFKY